VDPWQFYPAAVSTADDLLIEVPALVVLTLLFSWKRYSISFELLIASSEFAAMHTKMQINATTRHSITCVLQFAKSNFTTSHGNPLINICNLCSKVANSSPPKAPLRSQPLIKPFSAARNLWEKFFH